MCWMCWMYQVGCVSEHNAFLVNTALSERWAVIDSTKFKTRKGLLATVKCQRFFGA